MSFQNLKNKSKTSMEDLSKEVEKLNQNSFEKDSRFWIPEKDKTGNGFAIIRFLPAPEGEEVPWARIYNHSFKGPSGKWYIENCPTTKGGHCPVCEGNSQLWNSEVESNKEIARNRKRKLRYISNIFVIKDSLHPDNEGKVFLFNYGSKIFDKIKESMQPQFEGETAINPFDLWEGRDLKLKITTISGFSNYDKSEFAASTPFASGNEKAMEKVWNSEYKLLPFVDPSQFKSYDELSKKYLDVVNDTKRTSVAEDIAARTSKPTSRPAAATTSPSISTSEGESEMDFIKNLINEEE